MLSIEFTSSSPGKASSLLKAAEPAWEEIAVSGSEDDFNAFATELQRMRESSFAHARDAEIDGTSGTLWAFVATEDDRIFKVKCGCVWSAEVHLWEEVEQATKDCIENSKRPKPTEGYHRHVELIGADGPTGNLTIFLTR